MAFLPELPFYDLDTMAKKNREKLQKFYEVWTNNNNDLARWFLRRILAYDPRVEKIMENARLILEHGAASIMQHLRDGPSYPNSWNKASLRPRPEPEPEDPSEYRRHAQYLEWRISALDANRERAFQEEILMGFHEAMEYVGGTYKVWKYHVIDMEADVSDWLQGNMLEICLIAINCMLGNHWYAEKRAGKPVAPKPPVVNLRAQHHRAAPNAGPQYPPGKELAGHGQMVRISKQDDAMQIDEARGSLDETPSETGDEVITIVDHTFVLEKSTTGAYDDNEEVVVFVEAKRPKKVDINELSSLIPIKGENNQDVVKRVNEMKSVEMQEHLAQVLMYRVQYGCNYCMLSDGQTSIPMVIKQLQDHGDTGDMHAELAFWETKRQDRIKRGVEVTPTTSLLFLLYCSLVEKGLLKAAERRDIKMEDI